MGQLRTHHRAETAGKREVLSRMAVPLDQVEDAGLEQFPPYFGKCPEVIGSVLEAEARAVLDQTPLWMFGSQARED